MTLKDYSLKPAAAATDPVDLILAQLGTLDEEGLMRLRGEVDKKLALDPRNLNLADELALQYRMGKFLLTAITEDKQVPANQKSQVFNSVNASLEKIMKQMKVAFDAERLKRFEAAFMKVLVELPEPDRRRFFDLYGEYLTKDQQTLPEAA